MKIYIYRYSDGYRDGYRYRYVVLGIDIDIDRYVYRLCIVEV